MSSPINSNQINRLELGYINYIGFTASGTSDDVTALLTAASATGGRGGVAVPNQLATDETTEGFPIYGYNNTNIVSIAAISTVQRMPGTFGGSEVFGKLSEDVGGVTTLTYYYLNSSGAAIPYDFTTPTSLFLAIPYQFSFNTTPTYSPFNYLVRSYELLGDRGFEVIADDGVGTLGLTTSPTLLTINGLGGTTYRSARPEKLITAGTYLWDTSTNTLNPMAVNDLITVRIGLSFSSPTGNPTQLTLKADIGGTGTPTNTIFTDTKIIKSATEPINFVVPLYCLSTFLANGGKFFLELDSGTLNITDRNIFINKHT